METCGKYDASLDLQYIYTACKYIYIYIYGVFIKSGLKGLNNIVDTTTKQ